MSAATTFTIRALAGGDRGSSRDALAGEVAGGRCPAGEGGSSAALRASRSDIRAPVPVATPGEAISSAAVMVRSAGQLRCTTGLTPGSGIERMAYPVLPWHRDRR